MTSKQELPYPLCLWQRGYTPEEIRGQVVQCSVGGVGGSEREYTHSDGTVFFIKVDYKKGVRPVSTFSLQVKVRTPGMPDGRVRGYIDLDAILEESRSKCRIPNLRAWFHSLHFLDGLDSYYCFLYQPQERHPGVLEMVKARVMIPTTNSTLSGGIEVGEAVARYSESGYPREIDGWGTVIQYLYGKVVDPKTDKQVPLTAEQIMNQPLVPWK